MYTNMYSVINSLISSFESGHKTQGTVLPVLGLQLMPSWRGTRSPFHQLYMLVPREPSCDNDQTTFSETGKGLAW